MGGPKFIATLQQVPAGESEEFGQFWCVGWGVEVESYNVYYHTLCFLNNLLFAWFSNNVCMCVFYNSLLGMTLLMPKKALKHDLVRCSCLDI